MAADYKISEKAELIPLIIDSIYTSDVENMLKYLSEVISHNDDPKIQLGWMEIFINNMYEHNEKNMLQPFLDKIDEINSFSNLSSISFYIMKGVIDSQILEFLGNSIQDETFKTVIQNIAEHEESEYTRHGCINAEIMFGRQPREVYESLDFFNNTMPDGANEKVREYLWEKLDATEGSRGIPKWVSDTSLPIDKTETLQYIDIYLPSPREINEIFESLSKDGTIFKNDIFGKLTANSIHKTNDAFIAQYSILTILEKYNTFRSLMKMKDEDQSSFSSHFEEQNIQIDDLLFRRFGPVNTSYEQEIDSENTTLDICTDNGGCRMFSCLCGQSAEDEYDEDEDWFTGKCEKCHKRIGTKVQSLSQRRRCALREPLAYGSWRGCFCSFSCINMSIDDRYEDENETSTKNIQRILLLSMEIQIKAIGIDKNY